MNSPFPESVHDLTMFRAEGGLKEKMGETGNIRAVGDKGYRGENALISVHSLLDTPEVREFKKRAAVPWFSAIVTCPDGTERDVQ